MAPKEAQARIKINKLLEAAGWRLDLKTERLLPEFFYYVLLANKERNKSQSVRAVFMNLTTDQIREFLIPRPSLETQCAIVAEIEAEQALVNANRELIRRMEAKIKAAIDRVWGSDQVAVGASTAPAETSLVS